MFIVLDTASAATRGSNVILSGDTSGFRITERYNPPSGDSHVLLNLPLPFFCLLAITTVPWFSLFRTSSLALLFVDEISSKVHQHAKEKGIAPEKIVMAKEGLEIEV